MNILKKIFKKKNENEGSTKVGEVNKSEVNIDLLKMYFDLDTENKHTINLLLIEQKQLKSEIESLKKDKDFYEEYIKTKIQKK